MRVYTLTAICDSQDIDYNRVHFSRPYFTNAFLVLLISLPHQLVLTFFKMLDKKENGVL